MVRVDDDEPGVLDPIPSWLPARQLSQLSVADATGVLAAGDRVTALVLAEEERTEALDKRSVLGTRQLEERPGDMLRDAALVGGPAAASLAAKWLQARNERQEKRRQERQQREAAQRQLLADAHDLYYGSLVRGTVHNVVAYGAFVQLDSGLVGLLHISQITYEHVEHPSQVFKPGDAVTAAVRSVDLERGRLVLSTKALEHKRGEMLVDPQRVYKRAEEEEA